MITHLKRKKIITLTSMTLGMERKEDSKGVGVTDLASRLFDTSTEGCKLHRGQREREGEWFLPLGPRPARGTAPSRCHFSRISLFLRPSVERKDRHCHSHSPTIIRVQCSTRIHTSPLSGGNAQRPLGGQCHADHFPFIPHSLSLSRARARSAQRQNTRPNCKAF